MELVQIYLKNVNKLAVITNFIEFFQFLFSKWMRIHADPAPQPWLTNTYFVTDLMGIISRMQSCYNSLQMVVTVENQRKE